jgi:hypothetical protein
MRHHGPARPVVYHAAKSGPAASVAGFLRLEGLLIPILSALKRATARLIDHGLVLCSRYPTAWALWHLVNGGLISMYAGTSRGTAVQI